MLAALAVDLDSTAAKALIEPPGALVPRADGESSSRVVAIAARWA
jgi:hypothetical protein